MIKMSDVWCKKINELDKIIRDVEVGKDGRAAQLYRKRASLENALARCLEGNK